MNVKKDKERWNVDNTQNSTKELREIKVLALDIKVNNKGVAEYQASTGEIGGH